MLVGCLNSIPHQILWDWSKLYIFLLTHCCFVVSEWNIQGTRLPVWQTIIYWENSCLKFLNQQYFNDFEKNKNKMQLYVSCSWLNSRCVSKQPGPLSPIFTRLWEISIWWDKKKSFNLLQEQNLMLCLNKNSSILCRLCRV